MNPLALLARLGDQEVERERQVLAALDAQLDEQRHRHERECGAIERERAAADDLEGARRLAIWLAAARQRQQRIEAEVAGLERARAAQLERLLARRLELKRIELLQARQRARAAAAARAAEQRLADELALLRAARRRSG